MSKTKVEIIKSLLPIAPFVSPYTNGLKRSGQHYFKGRCPFHQKQTDPPHKRHFWVHPGMGLCGCFNPGCDANIKPMDVINFYARLKNISNSEAISELWRQLPQNAKEKTADPV